MTHLRCNEFYYALISRPRLPYTDPFPSPFSSVHPNRWAFSVFYFFYFLNFVHCNYQTSRDKTQSHSSADTHHFPSSPAKFPRISITFHV